MLFRLQREISHNTCLVTSVWQFQYTDLKWHSREAGSLRRIMGLILTRIIKHSFRAKHQRRPLVRSNIRGTSRVTANFTRSSCLCCWNLDKALTWSHQPARHSNGEQFACVEISTTIGWILRTQIVSTLVCRHWNRHSTECFLAQWEWMWKVSFWTIARAILMLVFAGFRCKTNN